MPCYRCCGLLVADRCYDLRDQCLSVTALRCVSCGDLIDPVILDNRRKQRAPLATMRHGKPLVAVLVA